MSELTISIDGDLLARSEARARALGLSINEFVVRAVEGEVASPTNGDRVAKSARADLEAMFKRADERKIGSDGKGWPRDETYGDRF